MLPTWLVIDPQLVPYSGPPRKATLAPTQDVPAGGLAMAELVIVEGPPDGFVAESTVE